MHNTWLKAIVAVSIASLATAQLSTVPDLSTATLTTASSSAASSTSAAASTTSATSATSTSSSSASTTSHASTTNAAASKTSGFSLASNFPTIAGAGVPPMIVPSTASAPFMQESSLPEGTVFIAVGAVLAFFGACVLLWRGLIAWTINRSVRKAALASIRGGSEKTSKNWGGAGTGYNPGKMGMYHDLGSSVSMEALTPTGKPLRNHFKDHDSVRSTPPSANLFFSPTAQARNNDTSNTRSSSYLPAGYYAQPSSHAAGGARNTVIGGAVPPYARNSAYEASPPASPNLRPATNNSLRPRSSNDRLRAPLNRDDTRNTVYSQASTVAPNLGGSRAPSAYLEDLFENHTAMAARSNI